MGFGLFIIFTVGADGDYTDSWTGGVGYDNGLAMVPSTTCCVAVVIVAASFTAMWNNLRFIAPGRQTKNFFFMQTV